MNMTYKLTRWCPKNGCTTCHDSGAPPQVVASTKKGGISATKMASALWKEGMSPKGMFKAKLQDIHGGNNNSIQWCIQCNRKFWSSWTFPFEKSRKYVFYSEEKTRRRPLTLLGASDCLASVKPHNWPVVRHNYWYIRLYLQRSAPPVVGCFFLSHMFFSTTKKSRLIWVIINRYLSKRVPTYQ